jgi:hypothetical protein
MSVKHVLILVAVKHAIINAIANALAQTVNHTQIIVNAMTFTIFLEVTAKSVFTPAVIVIQGTNRAVRNVQTGIETCLIFVSATQDFLILKKYVNAKNVFINAKVAILLLNVKLVLQTLLD